MSAKPQHRRSTYLLVGDFERMEEWGRKVDVLFDGATPYLVGSVHDRPDFRDVDVRVILEDEIFDGQYGERPAKVRWMNRAVSEWGTRETGLPIDFQVQRMTEANDHFGGQYRNPLGLRDWNRRDIPSG